MFCPNDRTEMHQVKIVSHYGQPIILDQCEKCGGIWFDESELFRAKQGEAENIELLDVEKLRTPTGIDNSNLLCPIDQAALFRFTDKFFPEDIILEHCPSCKGIWLNRGIFTKYQKFRDDLIHSNRKSPEDKALEENVRELVASYQTGRTTDVLRRLGQFLSSPEGDSTSLPAEPAQATQNAVTLVLNILITILRALILKF